MIRLKLFNSILVLMAICPGYAFSLETTINDKEQLLIGSWQQGLTAEIAALNAEQLAKYKPSGRLGSVVEYKTDHSFVLYPACGRKAEDLNKVGMSFLTGTWLINDTGDLVIVVSNKDKTLTSIAKIDWVGEQLVLTVGKAGTGISMGRYSGSLPLQCP